VRVSIPNREKESIQHYCLYSYVYWELYPLSLNGTVSIDSKEVPPGKGGTKEGAKNQCNTKLVEHMPAPAQMLHKQRRLAALYNTARYETLCPTATWERPRLL